LQAIIEEAAESGGGLEALETGAEAAVFEADAGRDGAGGFGEGDAGDGAEGIKGAARDGAEEGNCEIFGLSAAELGEDHEIDGIDPEAAENKDSGGQGDAGER